MDFFQELSHRHFDICNMSILSAWKRNIIRILLNIINLFFIFFLNFFSQQFICKIKSSEF